MLSVSRLGHPIQVSLLNTDDRKPYTLPERQREERRQRVQRWGCHEEALPLANPLPQVPRDLPAPDESIAIGVLNDVHSPSPIGAPAPLCEGLSLCQPHPLSTTRARYPHRPTLASDCSRSSAPPHRGHRYCHALWSRIPWVLIATRSGRAGTVAHSGRGISLQTCLARCPLAFGSPPMPRPGHTETSTFGPRQLCELNLPRLSLGTPAHQLTATSGHTLPNRPRAT